MRQILDRALGRQRPRSRPRWMMTAEETTCSSEEPSWKRANVHIHGSLFSKWLLWTGMKTVR